MTNTVQTTAQTPEAIALRLYHDVLVAEGRATLAGNNKDYLLNTYQDCLRATKLLYGD